ncbi:MAG: AAA family ATPase [Gemmataceae bacterium]
MLTRLRVRGFKNLHDVEIRFGPFTCVAGANGVGKSNLFDAIRFLHLLAQYPIMEAVQKVRDTGGHSAQPQELFTAFGDHRSPEVRFTADLIVERKVRDDFGIEAEAGISSLRYEVAFALEELEGVRRMRLTHESLDPIPIGEARRGLGFASAREFREASISGRRTKPYVSTAPGGSAEITVHQEGHGGRKLPAIASSRTVVSGLASSDFPAVLAVRREMESWRSLLLEPSSMRSPSRFSDPRTVDPRGGNLPAAIYRLQRAEDTPGRVAAQIVNQLARLLDDVHELRLREDEKSETRTVEVRGRDGVFHPARSLSDGTLRFLVLTVVKLDPEGRGLICLEEPENGIHPDRIPAIVDLLRGIAVSTEYPTADDNPLRQVIINTHSPLVVQHIRQHELVYLTEERISLGKDVGLVASARVPPASWRAVGDGGAPTVAKGDLIGYLGNVAGGWLETDYNGSGNGKPPAVHPGVGRVK